MAEALVVGALVSASFDVLFDRLASTEFISFFSKQKFDDGLVDELKTTLMALRALLDDAEDKQITNKDVKEWLDELQHVVYQADDLLDEIATKALRNKLEADDLPQTQSSTSKISLSRFFHLMKQFLLRINCFVSTPAYLSNKTIESKMKDVISDLKMFVEQNNSLNLIEKFGRKQSPREETTSLVDESDVFGRNNDKEKIMELLFSNNATGKQFQVIPIVGMGGMGKTTLAQLIYNNAQVNEKFHMKAWVSVSDPFDSGKITKKILDDVTESNNNIDSLDKLQIKLKVSLVGKKFLIVLDDVWNHDNNRWNNFKKPFSAGAPESRIIVTTRSEEVASTMSTNIPCHYLQQLSVEDCWSLFAKHAFESGDCTSHSNLESIGKQIVGKCKGLPLAVKSLGGLLRSTRDIEHWDDILKSEIWDWEGDVYPALQLSYHYLPSHLKRCFAHCSKFPKDYKFEKEKLVQLWIAEDLVQHSKSNKSMEDEGNYYFRQLLSRSFFQRLSDNNSYFVMHDLLHDLAQHISGKFCFRLDDDKPLDICQKVCQYVRHFSYVKGKYDAFEKFKVLNEVKYLRTLISFPIVDDEYWRPSLGSKVLNEMLPSLRYLRVLVLSHYRISKLPQSIKNLIHLRYLDLSWTLLKQLPDSVTTLCNLQTLDLSYCNELNELPVNIGKLIKLRYLDVRETKLIEMPTQMSRLKDLQQLKYFVVGKDGGSRISGLKDLCKLRGQLHISELQNVTSGLDASEANLKGKEHLEELELKWGGDTNDSEKERDVLDKLQPHARVKDLRIIKYGGTRFPDWLERAHLFGDMVSLDLIDCANCSSLPPIGQLPSLKNLRIKGMKAIRKVGQEFYGNASSSSSSSSSIKPFQCLETLSFKGMSEWEEWHALGAEEFSQLLELSVIDCPKLSSELSIRFPSLRKLEISNNERLVSNQVRLLLQGLPVVQKLKISTLTKLTELPQELQHLSSLQELEISDIPKLTELPQQLQHLSSLQKLEISDVPNLKELPQELQHLSSLQELVISNVPNLKKLPQQQLQHLSSLQKLKISSMPNLKELPQELCRLVNLERLKIEGCGRLVSFPDVGLPPMLKTLTIERCEGLQSLAAAAAEEEGIMNMNMMMGINNCRLEELHISYCSSLVEMSLPIIATLKTLYISYCGRLEFPLLPEKHNYHMTCSIEDLKITKSCDLLKSLWLGFFPKLRCLYINGCINLETLLIRNELENLVELRIWDCPKMVSFPHGDGDGDGIGLLAAPNLKDLSISDCENLKSLPQRMHTLLPSLHSLYISKCPEVESFPDGGLPSILSRLNIDDCKKLMKGRRGWGLQQQTSLEHFTIRGEYEEHVLESFPEEWLLPTTLAHLSIQFLPNLKSLNYKGLQHLTSLQSLYIWFCHKLQSLPKEGLPNSLSYLSIWDCPLLKPRCQREKGEDWSKISRIRCIEFTMSEYIVNLE